MKLSVGAAAAGAAIALVSLSATGTASAAAPSATGRHAEPACSTTPAKGYAACLDQIMVSNATGKPAASSSPSGLNPSDIQSAYNLGGTSSGGRTVAIVDAQDDPTAEQDLATYRSQFGLPECSTSNGCFSKVSQTGSTTSLPASDAGWATEISLDLDMVSATCPDCHILLVEADSASFADLGAAVNYAASQPGVVAISNSYGGSDSAASSDYDHPGIAITASTGDEGYGVESPASFDTVIAVGGTSLSNTGSGWSESAWSGAGSGCSADNDKPSWQTDATQCSGKANADVSAVADPNTGVSIYDSTPYNGASGWQVYGGTSASSPIIASVYALSGNTSGYPAEYTWAHSDGLNDVTSGSNGSCSTSVWCNAGSGWDGPTGLGTPNGTSAF